MRERSGRRARTRLSQRATEQPNPYVGPRAFEENESQFFFGRNEEIEILTGQVMARRASLLFAQSGAGKSSLLRAGLIPKLTRQETIGRGRHAHTYQKMEGLPILSVGGAIPSQMSEPIGNIYVFSALFSLFPDADPDRLANLTMVEGLERLSTEETAETVAAGEGSRRPLSGDIDTLLIFDQFEELFTKHLARWPDREGFFRQVNQAVKAFPTLHVLFSMREDYIAELTPYENLLPEQLRPRFRLERLQREAALQAVKEPASQAGRFYDEGVAEELVDNLRRSQAGEGHFRPNHGAVEQGGAETLGAYVEPVHLQIVCHQLWQNLPANELIILAKDVKQFGDVDQALTGFYEDSLARVIRQTKISQRRLRAWFDAQLITPAHTRGLVYRGDAETEGLPNEAVDILNDAYVIRASVRGSDVWYELAHDRLVEPIWTANRNWLVAYTNPLATAVQEWLAAGRDPRKLLRGRQLQEAQAYADSHPEDVMAEEQAFLEESLRYLNPLALAAQAWLDSARDPERLLDGSQLAEARTYAAEHPEELSGEEKEFLAKSLRQAEARQVAARQAAARRRNTWIAATIVIILLAFLSFRTFIEARQARHQEGLAKLERATAQAAQLTAVVSEITAVAAKAEADVLAITAQANADAAATSAAEAQAQRATAEVAGAAAAEARGALIANLEAQLVALQATSTASPTPPATPTFTHTPPGLPLAAPAQPTDTPTATPTSTPDLPATAAVQAVQAQLMAARATETAAALASTMARVPAGPFKMGSLEDSSGLPGLDRNPEPQPDEFPQREVSLPEFWIDRTEVSNADYRPCLEAGVCKPQSGGDPNYHTNPAFDRHPVIFISWEDAVTYCKSVGKRLPTEAEWEKAARGMDGRIWPWGNALQDNPSFPVQRANVQESNYARLLEVDAFPDGASPYRALNMTGNVWEWTADWYKPTYYRERPDPDASPPGPPEAESAEGRKVIRGGSYLTAGVGARTAERNGVPPGGSHDIGFRCAR